jgi:hypothetical protein
MKKTEIGVARTRSYLMTFLTNIKHKTKYNTCINEWRI